MSEAHEITKKMVDDAFDKWWNSDGDPSLHALWKSLEHDYIQQERAKAAQDE